MSMLKHSKMDRYDCPMENHNLHRTSHGILLSSGSDAAEFKPQRWMDMEVVGVWLLDVPSLGQ